MCCFQFLGVRADALSLLLEAAGFIRMIFRESKINDAVRCWGGEMVEVENYRQVHGRSKGHVALKSMPMQTIDDVLL